MSRSLNRATLIGRLGFDPEMRVTPQGSSVCTLKIATNERYKDKNGEWQESTDWHTVVLWDKLADIAGQYMRKGNQVYVEGKIRTRQYEKDGITRYFTEIVASNVLLLGSKSNEGGFDSAGGGSSYTHEPAGTSNNSIGDHLAPDENDEIPF